MDQLSILEDIQLESVFRVSNWHNSKRFVHGCVVIKRQCELAHDEIRCREAMKGADPETKAALLFLKNLLRDTRKSLA